MSTAETPRVSFDVAVGDDGSIKVPANEVARVGLRPGSVCVWLPEIPWEDLRQRVATRVAEHEARYASGGKWDHSSDRP